MNPRTRLRALLLVGTSSAIAAATASWACGDRGIPQPELTATTNAAIMPAGTNYSVTGTHYGNHETAVGMARPCDVTGCPGTPHWVVAYNNNAEGGSSPPKYEGWSYSTDLTGSSWTPYEMQDAGEWGGVYFANGRMGTNCADGYAFYGWGGDPSITPIYDPSVNNSGMRMLYASLVYSSNPDSWHVMPDPKYYRPTDVGLVKSENGGETWGLPVLVNTPTTGGYDPTHGWMVDQPMVASKPVPPFDQYSTWVEWTQYHASTQYSAGYISSVYWNASGSSVTVGVPQQVPLVAPPNPLPTNWYPFERASIAVGTVLTCSGLHEAVYVVWAADAGGFCSPGAADGGGEPASPVWYYIAAWDTVTSAWVSDAFGAKAWQLGGGDGSTPNDPATPWCIGGSWNNPNDAPYSSSSIKPRIAVDPAGTYFWVATVQSSQSLGYGQNEGTRVLLTQGQFVCANGQMTPQWFPQQWPMDPCYMPGGGGCSFHGNGGGSSGGGGGNGADGGYVVNDEWGPALNYLYNYNAQPHPAPELAITWYDTRGDQSNNQVGIWGAWTTCTAHLPLCPTVFSASTYGQVSTATWPYYTAGWTDYAGMGIDLQQYSFFAAWGGDARDGGAQAGIWSARFQ